jgi:hypothetical protein
MPPGTPSYVRSGGEYHLGQEERHRANLEALVAYHEEQARKYLPKGAA